MPELDAEHRDQLAARLGATRNPNDHSPLCADDDPCPYCADVADVLAPLVAGWLADAWDEGYEASDHEAYHFSTHGRTDNPYRGGDDG